LFLDRPEEPNHNEADRALDLFALGYEVVTLQGAGGHLPNSLAYYERNLALEIAGLLREPSNARLLTAKSVSERACGYCSSILAEIDPDSSLATDITSRLASFTVIRQRLNQQQPSVALCAESASLST
jgi:hypothetical protein